MTNLTYISFNNTNMYSFFFSKNSFQFIIKQNETIDERLTTINQNYGKRLIKILSFSHLL